MDKSFGHVLSEWLDRTGIPAAELGRRTYTSRSQISNIRHDRRRGDSRWAALADEALAGDGKLAAAWDARR